MIKTSKKTIPKLQPQTQDTFEKEQTCERCGCPVPDNVNETPDGHIYCDDDFSMDDVFPEDEEDFND